MKKITNNKVTKYFIKTSIVLIISNGFIGLIGYAYQVIIGRLLSIKDFAIFSASLAMIAIISTPLPVISIYLSKQVALDRFNLNNLAFQKKFIFQQAIAIILILIISIIVMLLDIQWKQYLNLNGKFQEIGFLLIFYTSILLVINNGYLQGLEFFPPQAILNIFASIVKIVSSFFLILVGFGLSGAFYGITISALMAWIIGFVYIYRNLNNSKIESNFPKTNDHGYDKQKFMPTIFSSLLLAIITQLDVPVVNMSYSAEDAGIYAAASVLGKIILFIPMSIIVAVYPITINLSKQNSKLNIIGTAFLVNLFFCLLIGISYFFLAEEIIQLVYGNRYLDAHRVLKYYGLALLPITFVIVIEHYLIAQGKLLFTWIILVIAPLQILIINQYNQVIINVVWSIFISGLIVLFTGLFYYFISYKFLKKRLLIN